MFLKRKQVKIQPEIIAIVGSGQGCGKTTVSQMLQMELGQEWNFVSTSDTLIDIYAEQTDIPSREIKANKQKYRPALIALGDKLEMDEPALLAKITMNRAGNPSQCIFESVRRASEVWYFTKKLPAFFVIVKADPEIRSERRGGLVCANHATEREAYEKLAGHPNSWIIENNDNDYERLKKEVIRFCKAYKNKMITLL